MKIISLIIVCCLLSGLAAADGYWTKLDTMANSPEQSSRVYTYLHKESNSSTEGILMIIVYGNNLGDGSVAISITKITLK